MPRLTALSTDHQGCLVTGRAQQLSFLVRARSSLKITMVATKRNLRNSLMRLNATHSAHATQSNSGNLVFDFEAPDASDEKLSMSVLCTKGRRPNEKNVFKRALPV